MGTDSPPSPLTVFVRTLQREVLHNATWAIFTALYALGVDNSI